MANIISHNNMYILEYIQETKQMTQFYFNMEEIQNNNFNKLYLEKEMSFLIVLNKNLHKILKKIHKQAKNN